MGGRLAGKTALITAAGQGIGYATAVAVKTAGSSSTALRRSITGRGAGDPDAVGFAP